MLGFHGEAAEELTRAAMGAQIAQNILGAAQGNGQVAVGLLDFIVGHGLGGVVGHGGGLDDDVGVLGLSGYGLIHILSGDNGDCAHERRILQRRGAGHQSHIRAPEHGRVGDGIAHFAAGMVGEIAHRIQGLLGGAGGDENPKALKILLTGENGLDPVIDVVRLGHFSLTHCAAGQMAGQRLHDEIAPLPQHGEILLGGGIFVHIGVHGGHQ